MIKAIYLYLILAVVSLGSSEYLYDYMDHTGKQLSVKDKRQFFQQYASLNNIEESIVLGKYNKAIEDAQQLSKNATNKLIQSKATILLYRSILQQNKLKDIIINSKKLYKAITTYMIAEPDLAEGYMLYIDYLIRLKKFDKAKHYATKMINTDDYPLYKEYGMIHLSKIYTAQEKLSQAQFVLNKVLKNTDSIKIASVAAGIQFDIYIKQKKIEQAKKMISNILKYNIEFFIANPDTANTKLNTLMKYQMYDAVIEIGETLIKRSQNEKLKPEYMYKVATAQLLTLDLVNAKENFINIIHKYKLNKYAKKAKVGLDEILLREGKLKAESLLVRYKDSPIMQQKILLNELINLQKDGKYKLILSQQKAYRIITPSIVKAYGYKDMDTILEDVMQSLAKQYLKNGECIELTSFLRDNNDIFSKIIKWNDLDKELLNCFAQTGYKEGFTYLNDKYKSSQDEEILYLLEKSAIEIKEYMEALKISFRLESLGSKEIRQKEIIDRFIIINNMDILKAKDDFFNYISNNRWLIDNTEDLRLIDILYQYYQFLEKTNSLYSIDILEKLYNIQHQMQIYVYSPFVDIELATYYYEIKDYKKSKSILEKVILRPLTKVKKVHRYYYLLAKTYNKLNMPIEYIQSIDTCIKSKGDSMWKQLCKKVDKLNAKR